MRFLPLRLLLLIALTAVACDDQTTQPTDEPARGRDAGGGDGGDTERDGSARREDGGEPDPPRDASPLGGARVRIVAANVTSGNKQSYEEPGMRILQGLHPDIVLLQEAKVATGTLRGFVDATFGADFSFYVDPRTTGIPNAVVSRYPILKSGVWADSQVPDRASTYAKIDVPGPIDLWAVSLHLLTSPPTARVAEAKQLAGFVAAEVPPGDYLVIGGDFNTRSDTEGVMTELGGMVVVTGPYPADVAGTTTNSTRSEHYDWVLARANLDVRKTPLFFNPSGSPTFPAGVVMDTRRFTPLSDVAPAQQGDSAAEAMQHMAVARDFLLQ